MVMTWHTTWSCWTSRWRRSKTIKLWLWQEMCWKSTWKQKTVLELTDGSKSLSRHLLLARWLNDALKQLKQNIPKNSVIQVSDLWFSRRGKLRLTEQRSCNPPLCYYPCTQCTQAMIESLWLISSKLMNYYNPVLPMWLFEANGYYHLCLPKEYLGSVRLVFRYHIMHIYIYLYIYIYINSLKGRLL